MRRCGWKEGGHTQIPCIELWPMFQWSRHQVYNEVMRRSIYRYNKRHSPTLIQTNSDFHIHHLFDDKTHPVTREGRK